MINCEVALRILIANRVNFAFHQNLIPIVSEIVLENGSNIDLIDITIRLASEPDFFASTLWRIERVVAGGLHHIATPDLRLDPGRLSRLTESIRAEVTLTVLAGEEEIVSQRADVQLLPPSHWGGVTAAPELLAAFVRPNDPAVDLIIRDAASVLADGGRSTAIDGYGSQRKARVWEIAEAIWVALSARGITYVLPPASFERTGQKVRSPSDIVERRVGTCLDLSLLYAACAEQAGLNPLLVLTEGHAFVGLWLKDEQFPAAIVDDAQILRKRRGLEEMVFIETTLLTGQSPASFAEAIRRGSEHLTEEAKAPLELAIDVKHARVRQIRPLDLGSGEVLDIAEARPVAPAVHLGLGTAPDFAEETVVAGEGQAEEPIGRLEMWKRKLLDLSLRNKLLNFKDTRNSIVLECPDPAKLEDLLAAGRTFKLLARTDVLGEGDGRSAALFTERHHDDGRQRYVLAALERGELHTRTGEKELDARLTDLFRIARTSFEEGGSNVLFLALGFLEWTQKTGTRTSKAPILLVPVSLKRASVRAGFRLALHEDEPRINPTLLEMLRQDFRLKMPELEGEQLPMDESGLDVARIWRIIATHVRDLKGWEVKEDVVVSTFSFTKYLMWKDLEDRTELLRRNPVVRHLIDTPTASYNDASGFPRPDRLDADYRCTDVFAPLSADSSQLAAVLAAAAGKDFVLVGPPGTGKSQTIANMIAQCLADRRTVLFVSQKTAALEVVQRRLRDIGLGDHCLEVHSAKAQKSSVLGQLKTAWHDQAASTAEEWDTATSELESLRSELNLLVSALHRRRGNGMTAYEAFGRSVAYRDRFTDIAVGWASGAEHSADNLAALRAACRSLTTAAGAVGDIAAHPLAGIEVTGWSPAWRNDMVAAIADLIARLPKLTDAVASFGTATGIAIRCDDPDAVRDLAALTTHLRRSEARLAFPFLTDRDGSALRAAVRDLLHLQEDATGVRRRLGARYRDTVLGEDLRGLLRDWTEAKSSSFLVRGSRQKRVRERLAPFVDGTVPTDPGDDLAVLVELAVLDKKARELGPLLSRFGTLWRGIATHGGRFGELIAWARETELLCARAAAATAVDEAALREHLANLLAQRPGSFEDGALGRATKDLQAAWAGTAAAIERLGRLAGMPDPTRPPAGGERWIEKSLEAVARWRANLSRAPEWVAWKAATMKAQEVGLRLLVIGLENGALARDEIESAFEAAYARWWIDQVVTEDAVLRGFVAARHEDAIAKFRVADQKVGEITKRIVRARLGGDVPPPTAFGSDPEWGTLARELTKKTRQIPLRQLFARIPTALTRLTPCVMMSPLSIAQYLPADTQPFDVVIFDEASQIPVWDAIGAIARGTQLVVVGDPQQLPPTSVGERGVDDVEDGGDITDQESILDECLAANLPRHRLDWHYRSRHESLIAFSNHAYYAGKLVTFPSPVTEDRAVRYVHVPGGVYERGTGRVNREEARAVTADIVRRLKEPAFATERRSLGVVTFNGDQQRLVENLLDQARRDDPTLEPFFDPMRWHEPVFVKNLENVQGDERDVILFSVAVGPDQTGRVAAQVSSLNKDGGHRRLNVAITRARRELVVFATLRPEQIDLSRTGARGVRDFKHFLEYAERGPRAIAEAYAATGRSTESPFEDAVMAALEGAGWKVHPQVGAASFRVDLGVVHPDAPGRYLAGVECDGATYHRSATARDRDRLREMVLTDLGWTIRRVWSTEWWNDAPRAFEKLQRQLLSDIEEDRRRVVLAVDSVAPAAPNIIDTPQEVSHDEEIIVSPVDDDVMEDGSGLDTIPLPLPFLESQPRLYADMAAADDPVDRSSTEYVVADVTACDVVPDPSRFYDPLYRSTLRAMVGHVIRTEGPVFDEVLIRRIARAHGFARAGGRVREAVLAAAEARFARTREGERVIFWPEGLDPTGLPPFRHAKPEQREHADIPLVELASLALRFLDEGADREEALWRMANHFALGRLREATKKRLLGAIELARPTDEMES